MIVITGATGKLGRLVIEHLLKKVPAAQIAVAVRDPEKAADFAKGGITVRQADYSKPETLEAAFAGAEKLLLISSSEVGRRVPQHTAVVEAAKKAKVGLLAYTSILHADRSTLALAADHLATEELIRASGLPFVFLRNGWYLENYTEHLAKAIADGSLAGAAGEGKLAAATRADFAEAAAVALTAPNQQNKVYELAGSASFTMTELAAEISKQSKTPVAYANLSAEQYREKLAGAGAPAAFVHLLVDSDSGVARGELDDTSGDLARLLGRPTTPLAQAVAAALK